MTKDEDEDAMTTQASKLPKNERQQQQQHNANLTEA